MPTLFDLSAIEELLLADSTVLVRLWATLDQESIDLFEEALDVLVLDDTGAEGSAGFIKCFEDLEDPWAKQYLRETGGCFVENPDEVGEVPQSKHRLNGCVVRL